MRRPSKGASLRLVELEASSRYAREHYRLYKAKAYGPKLTSPERLRRLERESKLKTSLERLRDSVHREAAGHAMSGLSQEARHLHAVIRRIDSDSEEPHPRIDRDEIDDVLGRAPGNGATRHALDELDVIGDLENVTRSGSAREPISFTLA